MNYIAEENFNNETGFSARVRSIQFQEKGENKQKGINMHTYDLMLAAMVTTLLIGLTISTTPLGFLPRSSTDNLFADPSCEYDGNGDGMPDYWRTSTEYPDVKSWATWSTDAYDGSRSLNMMIARNDSAVQWKGIAWRQHFYFDDDECPLERGKTYKWRCWYISDGMDEIEMLVAFWSYNGTFLSEHERYIPESGSSEWRLSDWVIFTIPEAQARFCALGPVIRLEDMAEGYGNGQIWADSFELVETTGYVDDSEDDVIVETTENVILTFDDAEEDVIREAIPRMDVYGWKGVLFVPTQLARAADFQIIANAGWEIGSHTLTHPGLTQISENEIEREVAESKAWLETNIVGASPVISLAYPHGDDNELVRSIVSRYYKYACDAGWYKDSSSPWNMTPSLTIPRYIICEEVYKERMKNAMDDATATGKTVVLLFHGIRENHTTFSITPEHFEECLEIIAQSGLQVVTFKDVDRMRARMHISITSPENKTHDTTDIPLTFTVDKAVSWIGYSLDGQANVTITGNTTLTGLSDGIHTVIIYANDTSGKNGASEIVYFSIETKPVEPFPPWIAATIVLIAGSGATLAVYLTKFKEKTEKTK